MGTWVWGTNIAHLFLPTAEPARWGPTVIIIIILIIHNPRRQGPGEPGQVPVGAGGRGGGVRTLG